MSAILLVETDPLVGAAFEDRLRSAGHTVTWLLDRQAAADTALASGVDLMILEVTQPGGVGLEVVSQLCSGGSSELPILVLSDSAESADRVAALRAGADDYITKPCDLEELVLRAERLLSSHAVAGPVLQGDLTSYPLWELTQYIKQAQKSGELVLRGPAENGCLRLLAGEVFDASWESLDGKEALLAVMGMKRGTFRFVSDVSKNLPSPAATPIDVGEVLMRAAWLEDELEKRRHHLPATGAPLEDTGSETAPAEDLDISILPVAQVRDLVAANPRIRIFDLIANLPRAPQSVRLAVAWLVEQGILVLPANADDAAYPDTAQLTSALLLEMEVNEFLTAARRVGFGTSALPFLILVEPGLWSELTDMLEKEPGYHGNQQLQAFVDQLKQRSGGSMRIPCEAGKLSLQARMLTNEICTRVEQIVSVCAGVLLWLDQAEDEELIHRVIGHLEEVNNGAAGVVVSSEKALPTANRLIAGTRRWRISPYVPQNLIYIFRLLQPTSRN